MKPIFAVHWFIPMAPSSHTQSQCFFFNFQNLANRRATFFCRLFLRRRRVFAFNFCLTVNCSRHLGTVSYRLRHMGAKILAVAGTADRDFLPQRSSEVVLGTFNNRMWDCCLEGRKLQLPAVRARWCFFYSSKNLNCVR